MATELLRRAADEEPDQLTRWRSFNLKDELDDLDGYTLYAKDELDEGITKKFEWVNFP